MRNQEVMRLLAGGFRQMEEVFDAKHALKTLDAEGKPATAASAITEEASPESEEAAGARVLQQVAERMGDNYPYFHPMYAGQMLKPPHPVARAAYAMAMAVNPNNHALDGGRASSRMEVEAVAAIAAMFGWTDSQSEPYLGHLTSSGTFANLEALWVAGQLRPNAAILASDQAHYTHSRMSSVLKLPFEVVASDHSGRMDMEALEARLLQSAAGDRRPIGTIVVTLGTTATGSVDPLDKIVELREKFGFRIHVDAAYGGYFKIGSTLSTEIDLSFDCINVADSIVIDPHKHGLQPYGCGCVLFRDPSVGRFYKHDSPYTYFSSKELHLGEISLECSRAGASAVALWATQQLLPMHTSGAFAADLDRCRMAAVALYEHLIRNKQWLTAFPPQLDIVVWTMPGESVKKSSEASQAVFEEAAKRGLHLATVRLPVRYFPEGSWTHVIAGEEVICLRSVLMKPEHQAWLPTILAVLEEAQLAAHDAL